ncbi:hypothetical protein [Flavivirga eckloniae]|uniref:Uncharacterized protein n=1 Tax=Flavivirga eckloniae TaxID=1803846 RepID=A0A2K9PL22_9FLAO|nr:hypothetical protein [Flavivirga eckloniae]AUP77726.1 hypothetical protein C1H87_02950 [Flavivirga eckloniae]
MLKIGGYINIVIAIAHLVGLIWAEQMFEVTGIGKEMIALAQSHFSLPYVLTIFVSIIFFVFGLYGLSADGKLKELPFLKPAIFIISGIYIVRGIGELIFDLSKQQANPIAETIYSLIALTIGILFLIGGLKKWAFKKENV